MTYWDTNIATVWAPGSRDAFGQITYGTPYTIAATWMGGGKTGNDRNGEEFQPMSTFFTLDSRPKLDDYIARGDLTAQATPPAADAEIIRQVVDYDMSQFGEPTEYELRT